MWYKDLPQKSPVQAEFYIRARGIGICNEQSIEHGLVVVSAACYLHAAAMYCWLLVAGWMDHIWLPKVSLVVSHAGP